MNKKRKVLNNGSGLLTGLILLCILLVAGVSITGYEHFKNLRDRQKLVEDTVSRTMEQNLSEGMEKIEEKIIYQQLPQEESEEDKKLREELEKVREETRISNEKTAYEVINRLNISDGLAEDTLQGMQQQLEAMKNDTANADHIGQLEENLGKLQDGLNGLENTAQNNKNSLIDKLGTLEQALIDYKTWLEKIEVSIQDTNVHLENNNQSNQTEIVSINNQIQELRTLSEQYLKELSEQKNLIEVYQNQTQLLLEQTNGSIAELDQRFLASQAELDQRLTDSQTELDQRLTASLAEFNEQFITKSDELKQQLTLRIDGLENALGQVYTKEEVNGIIRTLNLDTLNQRVNDCFQSVSDGKKKIASAITDKGIDTAADATFQQMADNINGLITMSTDPSVLFDVSSWTAPYDCIAVMSFSVGFTGNDKEKQTATVTLSGVKSWDTPWGENHDSHWHDREISGNATWEAKAGQTYQLSFGTTSDGHILTWGWNSRTWIVPQSGKARTASASLSFYEKKQRLMENGKLSEDVPWMIKEETPPQTGSAEEESSEPDSTKITETEPEEPTTEEVTKETTAEVTETEETAENVGTPEDGALQGAEEPRTDEEDSVSEAGEAGEDSSES